MIYVTHDQVEAMTLADKIVVLRDGRVEQVGKPIDLYENPANQFVAGFIGSPKMNFFGARVVSAENGKAVVAVEALGPKPVAVAVEALPRIGAEVTLGVRPEHIFADTSGAFAGTVKVVEQLGSVSFLYVEATGGAMVTIEQRRLTGIRPGESVSFGPEDDHLFLFDKDGRRV
jgi:lactose/L-arabinose transport system ATP-binding protein